MLLVLMILALILPSSTVGGGRTRTSLTGLRVAYEREGGAAGTEWARLRRRAWLRGREAAKDAAGEAAAVRAAASGPGAAAPATWIRPAAGHNGIPALALRAYREAAAWAEGFDPRCELSWTVLAGIGRIESNHGMHWGQGTRFSRDGLVGPRIAGPPLDGRGVARIADSDGGRWDGDTTWDRAVGPMQFIPSTWRRLGRDGNGDGVADPNNLFDAATSAAAYLCLAGSHLTDRDPLRQAVYAYNHSWQYVDAVLGWASIYVHGVTIEPATTVAAAAARRGQAPPSTVRPIPLTSGEAQRTRPSTSRPAPTTRPPAPHVTATTPAATGASTTTPPTTATPPTTGPATTAPPATAPTTTAFPTTSAATTTSPTTTEPCVTTTTLSPCGS